METENKITTTKNMLCILFKNGEERPKELQYLIENFCGQVVENLSDIGDFSPDKRIYVCGDIDQLKHRKEQLFIIKEFSHNYENHPEAGR